MSIRFNYLGGELFQYKSVTNYYFKDNVLVVERRNKKCSKYNFESINPTDIEKLQSILNQKLSEKKSVINN